MSLDIRKAENFFVVNLTKLSGEIKYLEVQNIRFGKEENMWNIKIS